MDLSIALWLACIIKCEFLRSNLTHIADTSTCSQMLMKLASALLNSFLPY